MFAGLPRQADGQHLTADGYRALAAQLVSQVAAYLKK
jgi:lysophospholipase L1-like esterase